MGSLICKSQSLFHLLLAHAERQRRDLDIVAEQHFQKLDVCSRVLIFGCLHGHSIV